MTDIVTPPTIDALPPAPLPTDTPEVFDSKTFASFAAQVPMVTQINASNASTAQNATAAGERAALANTAAGAAAQAVEDAGAQVALAAAQASIATGATNYRGIWSDLAGPLNKPASVKHQGTFWLLNTNLADVTTAVPGVSPAWSRAARTGSNDWKVITANYTASPGDALFVDTTAGPVSVTLPAAPNQGDTVSFADHAGLFVSNPLTVLRNGKSIGGIADDLLVDVSRMSFDLIYSNTKGWVFA